MSFFSSTRGTVSGEDEAAVFRISPFVSYNCLVKIEIYETWRKERCQSYQAKANINTLIALSMKQVPTCYSMLTILSIGTPGARRHYRKRSRRISQFCS